ncbi:DUF4189 domain-containing protein [Desulfosediminicola flagellatus]|uniref:DUF4189 domain-containing protein n=1 Tax=Desulfosediminicola flagellatus TaxID=2569541 RepID=UPI0010ABFD1C|nr:DUF4189 domain-containing protein [Desulfosediminicola flagellatus]
MKRLLMPCLILVGSMSTFVYADNSRFNAKYGALAIDKNNSFAYGWAVGHDSLNAAVERAKEECAKNSESCSIVLKFSGGCGVYRTIDNKSGNAYGWGVAPLRYQADKVAMDECLSRSDGIVCDKYVWGCNDRPEYEIIYDAKKKSFSSESQLAEIFRQIDTVIDEYGSNVRINATTNDGLTNYSHWAQLQYDGEGIFKSADEFKYDTNKSSNWNPGKPDFRFFDPTDVSKLENTDMFIKPYGFKSDLPTSDFDYSASPTGREVKYLFINRKNAYVGDGSGYISSATMLLYDDGAEKVKKLLLEAVEISK